MYANENRLPGTVYQSQPPHFNQDPLRYRLQPRGFFYKSRGFFYKSRDAQILFNLTLISGGEVRGLAPQKQSLLIRPHKVLLNVRTVQLNRVAENGI